ncbi:MAG: hypothetical protein DMG22_03830 [Acidobacteria bacterium]|nr:MAG: hypothetical protein DMG22_03830 [Acidobacteriota bacterium]
MKRLAVIAILAAAPFLAGTAETPKTEGLTTKGPEAKAIEWLPAPGPAETAGPADDLKTVQGLTVHEWGTFTSIAGPDGRAINWLPAGGPTDLPCFVAMSGAEGPKRFADAQLGGRADRALVRMETPVLYFYSPRSETVNVKVSFHQGVISEWYPAASVSRDTPWQGAGIDSSTGVIRWTNVKIMPGATESYPLEDAPSHYYAARRTGSAPLQVSSQATWWTTPTQQPPTIQNEKFLFYRGLGSFQPAIAAQALPNGKVMVTNLGDEETPIVLFENRGGKIGYRIPNPGLAGTPLTLDPPVLTTGNLDKLYMVLEAMLKAQGMFPQEARAMVETWKDSWFEQGTRVFYIMPKHAVDSILPLDIEPRPVDVARAFVGRMEVITPATQNEVRTAIQHQDRAALETYGRFLEPIVNGFLAEQSEADRKQADWFIQSIRAGYVAGVSACMQQPRKW